MSDSDGLDGREKELLGCARKYMSNACARYSNYRVGAAVLAKSGRI